MTEKPEEVQQAELNIYLEDKAVGHPQCELVIQVKQPLVAGKHLVTEFRFTERSAFTLMHQLATKIQELKKLNAPGQTPEELYQ